jgi:hypothetical protein
VTTTTTRSHTIRRIVGLAAATVAAAGLGTVAAATPASASQAGIPCIGWDQLSHTPDGDHIGITAKQIGDPRAIYFQLTTPSNITWWKQIKFVNGSGDTLSQDYTQDGKHVTTTVVFYESQLNGASLVFSKAKAFGVHTDMFQLCNLNEAKGNLFIFNWDKD